MCYETSAWFDKLRAKQLRKAQEKADAAKTEAPKLAPDTPAPAPAAAKTEREKVPV
jgi:hypothetical protein